MTLFPVIMCGGAGSRLWPRSRKSTPKQFISLIENRSLLAATAARLLDTGFDEAISAPGVICGQGQDALVQTQMCAEGQPPRSIVVEPFGRNTAAVAAVASLEALDADPDAIVLLLPADHHVADKESFWKGVMAGLPLAQEGYLVTLGIEPTGPETGYGYIQRGARIGDGVYKVENFKEKPDVSTAEQYLSTGEYSWNAGIFLFRADRMKEAFRTHAPGILAACEDAMARGKREGSVLRLDPDAFEPCPDEPVDIAIFEKADRVAVVAPVRAGWNDVGSWDAVAQLKIGGEESKADSNESVIAIDCENCLIETDGPLVAAIGLEDLVIMASGDAILITHRGRTQAVKKVVNELKARARNDLL